MTAPQLRTALFEVAANPDPDSTLPFLIRLPLPGGELVLKARDSWPRTAKVYCHRAEDGWPEEPEIIEQITGPLLPAARGRDRPGARPPTREPLPARVHPHPGRTRGDLLAIGAHDPPSPTGDPRPAASRRRVRSPHDPRSTRASVTHTSSPTNKPAPSGKRSPPATTGSRTTARSSLPLSARASPTSSAG